MKAVLAALALFLALGGCREALSPTAEYRPEEAGTVDHALCLLGFTAVQLRKLVTGHHLVNAKLNGRDGIFLLDTGANATVLDAGEAAAFGVGGGAAMPGAAVGLGGAMKARQSAIESLAIGPVPIRRDRIMTADLGQVVKVLGPLSGGAIHGIIGQDVMEEHRAVIDVARPILYLMPEDTQPAPVPAERCRAAGGEGEPEANRSATS
jgi:hypothetical protein